MEDDTIIQHPVSDRSILDLLREDYDEIKDIKNVFIPIVGWERTGLSIRYRLPSSGIELDAIARKVNQEVIKSNQYERNFKTALDTIIALNEGLFVMPPGVDQYIQLDPQLTGEALTIADGEELSAIFGWGDSVNTARKVVMKLFNNNDLAMINHASKLNRWLMDTRADITTEIWELGEL